MLWYAVMWFHKCITMQTCAPVLLLPLAVSESPSFRSVGAYSDFAWMFFLVFFFWIIFCHHIHNSFVNDLWMFFLVCFFLWIIFCHHIHNVFVRLWHRMCCCFLFFVNYFSVITSTICLYKVITQYPNPCMQDEDDGFWRNRIQVNTLSFCVLAHAQLRR